MSKKVIHKYSIVRTHQQIIVLPIGAEILTVQAQYNSIQLWTIVDSGIPPTEYRTIVLYTTGATLSGKNEKYLGTVQLDEGNMVLHAFEQLENPL